MKRVIFEYQGAHGDYPENLQQLHVEISDKTVKLQIHDDIGAILAGISVDRREFERTVAHAVLCEVPL